MCRSPPWKLKALLKLSKRPLQKEKKSLCSTRLTLRNELEISDSTEELINLPLIVSRQGATNEMPQWLQKNYSRLHIVATYDLIFNASILVREGLGYALGFDKLIHTGAGSVLCFRPIEPTITSPMRLIWRKEQEFSEAAGLFLEKIKSVCK